MAGIRQKGKIPHSEWPKILARYKNGETIAKIGRDYGCTAPAIRYIVKRNGMLKGDTGVGRGPGGSKSKARRPISSSGAQYAMGDEMAPVLATTRHGRATGGRALDPELRKRVSGDVATFLVALDQAVLDASVASIMSLQEAADRLMRSTARTRLELERLLRGSGRAGVGKDVRNEVSSEPA